MPIVKKILILQLLTILAFSQVGYYFFYTIKQYQIREAVKHQLLGALPESSLQIFAADNEKIVWEENEKEFSIDGEMYDIAKIKIVENKKYFYCLSDTKETALINEFVKTVQKKTDNKQEKDSKDHFKFQTLSFQPFEETVAKHFFKSNKTIFPIFKQNPISVVFSVIGPPPKV